MSCLLWSTLLLLSTASIAGGQDFSSLWNSITNGGSSVGNSAVDIAKSTWDLVRNGGSTVGTGASNLTQSVGNFVRGNGFQTNANRDQQRSSQSNQYSGDGYYGDSPYKYNGYDYGTQRPSYDQNQNYNRNGYNQEDPTNRETMGILPINTMDINMLLTSPIEEDD
ncbi:hypothetical protein PENTCL1PPCAC_11316, partial [Pristionchus entomophagus]